MIDPIKTLIYELEKAMTKYAATEKKPHDYGTGQLLYRSEIHTIDGIGKHPNTTVTQLANYLVITKGAVSQMIEKLIKKELVIKTILSASNTKVALNLTPKGNIVFTAHTIYHQGFYQQIESLLSELSADNLQTLITLTHDFQAFLDKKI